MGTTWYPGQEFALLNFAQAFSAHATATPGAYNFSAGDALALATAVSSFASTMSAAADPTTRTRVSVSAKNLAKRAVVDQLMVMKRKVEAAHPPLPLDKREELGLSPRDETLSVPPAPATAPMVAILSVTGLSALVRITDLDSPTKRARPTGTAGAEVFSFQGDTPSGDLRQWTFEGLITRSSGPGKMIHFPPTIAGGTKIWLCARWYNQRGQSGPVSAPAFTHLGSAVAHAA